MTGPGLPYIGSVFATLGFLPPLLVFSLFSVISAFSILFIIEAMQAMPGNRHFQGTVEFGTLVNFYFGPLEHIVAQVFLYGAIQSQAMNSIIMSSQILDGLVLGVFGKACGVVLPNGNTTMSAEWTCFQADVLAVNSGSASPFGSVPVLLTIGFVLVAMIVAGMCIRDLEDTIHVQIGSFILTMCIALEWICASVPYRVTLPPVIITSNFGNLLGPVILNFATTIYAPTWINFKERKVNAQTTVWFTMALATFIYSAVGVFNAVGFPELAADSHGNMNSVLQPLQSQKLPSALFKTNLAFCTIFALAMLIPSIPVAFFVSYNNIIQNFNLPDPRQKYAVGFACFILPWLLCIPLQTGNSLGTFMNWTGVLLVSPANFVIPFLIYFKCLRFRKSYNITRELTAKQTKILKMVHCKDKFIQVFLDGSPRGTLANVYRRASLPFMGSSRRKTRAPPSETPQIVKTKDPILPSSVNVKVVEWTDGESLRDSEAVSGTPGVIKVPDSIEVLTPNATPSSILYPSPRFPGKKLSVESRSLDSHCRISIQSKESKQVEEVQDEFWLREPVPDPEEELSDTEGLPKRRGSIFFMFGGNPSTSVTRVTTRRGDRNSEHRKPSFDVNSVESYNNASTASPTFKRQPINNHQGEEQDPNRQTMSIPRIHIGSDTESPLHQIARDSAQTLAEERGNGFEMGLSPILEGERKSSNHTRGSSKDNESIDLSSLKRKKVLLNHRPSVPFHPNFISPTFRAVPLWIPIQPYKVALFLVVVTSVLSVVVLALQANGAN
ncbi:hypothetical protein HDU79_004820 [Rhizoclosmatium sp. JEL0117]|nr:hypothetical protein HDU79_004820 [Rhizoclosmatium sp. JEL0117]